MMKSKPNFNPLASDKKLAALRNEMCRLSDDAVKVARAIEREEERRWLMSLPGAERGLTVQRMVHRIGFVLIASCVENAPQIL